MNEITIKERLSNEQGIKYFTQAIKKLLGVKEVRPGDVSIKYYPYHSECLWKGDGDIVKGIFYHDDLNPGVVHLVIRKSVSTNAKWIYLGLDFFYRTPNQNQEIPKLEDRNDTY